MNDERASGFRGDDDVLNDIQPRGCMIFGLRRVISGKAR